LSRSEQLIRSLSIDSVEDHSEDKESAEPPDPLERVRVEQARHEEREYLPGGHDYGKDYGSKLLDGIEDEKLSGCRGDGEDAHVQKGRRVPEDEGHGGQKLARLIQSQACQQLFEEGRGECERGEKIRDKGK
jgi:hypothetical protein